MKCPYSRLLQAILMVLFLAGSLPAAAADAAAPVRREIIPGSELMTTQEREQYRQRQRGAGSEAEREKLRADHVRAMEERARLRGLKVSDPTRERARKGAP